MKTCKELTSGLESRLSRLSSQAWRWKQWGRALFLYPTACCNIRWKVAMSITHWDHCAARKIAGQGNTSQVCCGIWKSRWLSYRRTDSFLKILEKQETWDCGLLNPPEQLDQSWPWLRAGFSPSKNVLLRNFVNNFVYFVSLHVCYTVCSQRKRLRSFGPKDPFAVNK